MIDVKAVQSSLSNAAVFADIFKMIIDAIPNDRMKYVLDKYDDSLMNLSEMLTTEIDNAYLATMGDE